MNEHSEKCSCSHVLFLGKEEVRSETFHPLSASELNVDDRFAFVTPVISKQMLKS